MKKETQESKNSHKIKYFNFSKEQTKFSEKVEGASTSKTF